MPLRTLNPPQNLRFARVAATARLKLLQDVSAEMMRILVSKQDAALRTMAKQAPRPKAAKRGKKTAVGLPEV
jgi:hypothetical protein